jgi:hypothetical protein
MTGDEEIMTVTQACFLTADLEMNERSKGGTEERKN